MEGLVTASGVSLMLNDSAAAVVVQVLDIKPTANHRYTCTVTDGIMKTKATLPADMSPDVESGKIEGLGLVRVLSYTSHTVPNQPNKVLVITKCEVVCVALDSEVRGPSSSADAKSGGKSRPFVVKSAAQIVKEEHCSAAPATRMGISRRVYPLVSLTPYQGSWTIKVRVTGKGPLRTYRNARGEGSVFNVELTDEDGTQIQATMFKEAAEKFYSKFQLGKVYFISKGSLRVANRQFSTVKNDYEMNLHANSDVEEVPEEDTQSFQTPSLKFNLVKIEDLGLQINKKELFDVIGVVQSVSSTLSVRRKADNSEFAKREVTVVDQSQKTVVVTLWGALALEDGAKLLDMVADAPVIVVRFLRANDFQGVSLSTTTNSTIFINPDVVEATTLRDWYDEVGKSATLTSIGATLAGGGAKGGSRSMYDDRALLASITGPSVGEEKPAYFSVRGCISYIKPDQAMWYMACSTCNRKVSEETGGIWCEGCQKHSESSRRRYILLAKMTDSSGEAWVSAFNDQAEQILGISADSLADIRSQDGDQNKDYESRLKSATWVPRAFRVSVAQSEYMGEKRQRVTVRSVSDMDWSAESKLLLGAISRLKTAQAC